MKSKIEHVIMYVVAFIIALSFNNLFAQDPCDDDPCLDLNNVSWISDDFTWFPNPAECPECWIQVFFRYRFNHVKCPETKVEFRFDNILVSGACYVPCGPLQQPIFNAQYPPQNQYNNPWAVSLLETIKAKVIPELLPDTHPGVITFTSAKQAGCNKQEILPNGDHEIVDCDIDGCCIQELTITTDIEGNIISQNWDVTSEHGEPCGSDPEGECVKKCVTWDDVLIPKIGIKRYNDYFSGISLYPNPAKNTIKIEFYSINDDIEEDFDIFIVDETGAQAEIFHQYGNLTNLEIDLSAYSSGSYFLVVRNNTNTIYTKKFVVTK